MIVFLSKINKVFKCIPFKYKKKIFPLVLYNLINVLLDLLSIALLLPFLMLIFNPKLSYDNEILSFIFNPNRIYYSLFFLILFFLLKNILSIQIIKYQSKLVYNISSEISKNYITNFLYKGYLNYQNKIKGDIIRNAINVPGSFTNYILMPIVTIFSEAIIFLIISIFGFVFFFKFSISILTIIFIALVLIYLYRKRKLKTINMNLKTGYNKNINYLLDIINGYLNIKSNSKEQFFLKRFNNSNNKLNNTYAYLTALRTSNNKYIEIIIVIVICFLVLYLLNFSNNDNSKNLILISLLASISLKLIPSLNKMFIAFSNLKAYNYTIGIILAYNNQEKKDISFKEGVNFTNKLVVKNVNFYYNKDYPLLKNINLEITKGQITGLFGRTGSGKTTLIHIILKLIKPTSGIVSFDNNKLDNSWLKTFGYISQQTHIYSGTIIDNIAIGEEYDQINFEKINELIKIFNFEKDLNNFSDGIYTNTGNSGQLLSGGQKQKIALIRALYFNPKILILDEATNQLDVENEVLIFKYIKKLVKSKKLTVILISHNHNVLSYCDKLYQLKNNTLHEANI